MTAEILNIAKRECEIAGQLEKGERWWPLDWRDWRPDPT
jgi:hypothetical protein